MRFLVLSFAALVCFAQPQQVTPVPRVLITVNHQPVETFKAAFLTVLPNVGLYEATVCNNTESALEVSHGPVMQLVSKRLTLVSTRLAIVTMDKARRNSKLYKTTRVLVYVGYLGAVITTGGFDVSSGVQLLFPVLGSISDNLSRTYETKGLAPGVLFANFLDAEKSMVLKGRTCGTALFLARYVKGTPETLDFAMF